MPLELRSMETVKLVKASQLNLLDAWDYEFNFSHVVNNNSSLTMGGINNFVYGFDESSTHAIDIDSTGIDFNLFGEREFDEVAMGINCIVECFALKGGRFCRRTYHFCKQYIFEKKQYYFRTKTLFCTKKYFAIKHTFWHKHLFFPKQINLFF